MLIPKTVLKDETPPYGSEDDIIALYLKTVLKDETPLYGSEDDIIDIFNKTTYVKRRDSIWFGG